MKRLQVYDNGVPVFGSTGIDVSGENSNEITREVTISLTSGLNEIRATAMNTSGQESLAASFEVQHTAEYDKPDLYMVSIGVSEYQQSDYNLTFAAKDANDMVNTLGASSAYENVYSKILTNSDATDANIQSIRSFVEGAKVDDVVIVFIAGHGVLDSNYTYFFATHNMDFNNPANGGLSYEALEKLIDGIPCRNISY